MNKGTLYLCATPIGNLEDISIRTLNTLRAVDLIACEDTRHSLRLLNHFEISKPLTSYHEHNKHEKGIQLIQQLQQGVNIALVSDAGTPAISDPGEDLVKKCIDANICVVPIPGPSALICALVMSGQNTGRFAFEGFLSMNRKNRIEHLESLVDEQRTMIFYEAPHKLTRTLADMYKYFGDRDITLVKELTKIHESSLKTTLAKAVEYYADTVPKGEFVLVVAGKSNEEIELQIQAEFETMTVVEHVNRIIASGADKKDAIKEVAKLRGLPKREVYNLYIEENE